jgi:tetratricopeptide (TPR) repeat protein
MSMARSCSALFGGCLMVLALSGGGARAAGLSDGATPGYSASTLYNQANADARAGKPGLAVLNYQRALLLAPNDADIRANLAFVRAGLNLPAESDNWFSHAIRIAGPDALAWMAFAGLLAAGLSLLAGRRYPSHRFALRAVAVLGVSAIGLTLCNAVTLWPRLHEGVVTAHGTAAHVAPAGNAETLFSLPEAETVAMGAQHQGFVLVQARDGRSGWVALADLAPVLPNS